MKRIILYYITYIIYLQYFMDKTFFQTVTAVIITFYVKYIQYTARLWIEKYTPLLENNSPCTRPTQVFGRRLIL